MLRHNVIHLIHQIQSLECDVSTAFLKVANSEQLIFENLLMRIIAHKIHKPDGDIMPVIGNGLPIQQVEHPFQIGKLISPPAPVQAVAPSVMLHQIVNDNLLTEITGIIGFVVPAQSLKYIDNPTFENVLLVMVQLLKVLRMLASLIAGSSPSSRFFAH